MWKRINENQKFCSECGAKIGESDMQEIINIKWLVISVAAIAIVFGTCILATQNNSSANTSNNNVNNEVVEDTNTEEKQSHIQKNRKKSKNQQHQNQMCLRNI